MVNNTSHTYILVGWCCFCVVRNNNIYNVSLSIDAKKVVLLQVLLRAVINASFDVTIVTFFFARVMAVYSNSRVIRVSASSVIAMRTSSYSEP